MRFILFIAFQFFISIAFAQKKQSVYSDTYSNSNRVRSGIAHGGIGAGSIELRKDGQFYNWSILNNWPLGAGTPLTIKSFPHTHDEDSYLFFLVRYQVEGEKPQVKLLQLNNSLSEGALQGIVYYFPWMSAIDKIEYSASFPFTNLRFTDPDMPFDINFEVYSPFIPHDIKNSALPGIYFNYSIMSKSDKPVKVLLIASLRNLVGYDITEKYFVTEQINKQGMKGFSMTCAGMDTTASSWGKMGLFSTAANASYYLGWEHKHPYYEKLLVSDKFGDVNDTENRNKIINGKKIANFGVNKDQRCFSSIGTDFTLNKGEKYSDTFILAWYFPNNYGAVENAGDEYGCRDYKLGVKRTFNQGHYYNNFFNSASDVARYMISNKEELSKSTEIFHSALFNSSLPQFVLNQINSQLNTFSSSSTFTKAGNFAIREGLAPSQPWGPNATIDVSLYASPMIISLFPDLQKGMMRQHMKIQGPNGEINHGLAFDITKSKNGTWGVYDRIDLVPNYIQMVLRDYFMTNDKEYLQEMWPSIVKGMNYTLTQRDKNGDMMPDMEGIMCSYDNFPMYGLASYIQSQWLAAMASVKKAASDLGDKDIEIKAGVILRRGKKLMDEKLWNGHYYDLFNDYTGEKGSDHGVLTDQMIGQWVASQSNLGYLFNKNNIDTALQSILKYSYSEDFGLRNCTWPEYPDLYPIQNSNLWVDQANTCWSGVELAFASLLIYEGYVNEGEKVIKTVDDRYRKAGLYWDHQEFGGHYYRPMSTWSILHAYLGLGVNCGHYSFYPKIDKKNYNLLFSYGNGLAEFIYSNSQVVIKVLSGNMYVRSFEFKNVDFDSKKVHLHSDGKQIGGVKARIKDGSVIIDIPNNLTISMGDSIVIK